MPILKNAKKALRVSKRKTALNQPIRSRAKSALDSAKKNPTVQNISAAFSAIDRAVKRHIIQKKKAARLKSRLTKSVSTAEKTVSKSAAKVAKTAKKVSKTKKK